MNGEDKLRFSEDALLKEAEAYDASLRGSGKPPAGFAEKHSDLAAVFRLLNDVFESPTANVVTKTADARVTLPAKLERFRMGPEIGRGGFSTVYRAFDEVLERDVAIKVVPGHFVANAGQQDHRLVEARAAARLSHLNIVPLYEVHQENDAVYLVSEFCDGPTLSAWLSENPGPVQPPLAAEIILQLAEAVSHAHSRGLIHRDIKPGNVLLGPTEERDSILGFTPRLTDFGLVRDLRESNLTASSLAIAGTCEYMPPEQILGGEPSVLAKGDIYSLGVLFYRMITGRLPHEGDTTVALLQNICTAEPIRPRVLEKKIPRDLEAICLKCLSKKAVSRYATANQLSDEIVRWKQGRNVAARPQPFWERGLRTIRRSPVESALIAIALWIATTAAIIQTQSNDKLTRQGESLSLSLVVSRAREQRAVAAEHAAIEALEEARLQREKAEASQLLATLANYRADLIRGFEDLQQGRFVEARAISDKIQQDAEDTISIGTDLRILKAMASRGSIPLASHTGPVHSVVTLPGSHLAVSGGEDGVVRFYDTRDGRTVREISMGQRTRVHALACNHDGEQLAIGYAVQQETDTDNSIRIVERENWDVTQEWTGFPSTVESVTFSPDGKRLAIGCRYEPILIRSVLDAQECISLPSDRRNEEVLFSPSGNEVLVFDARDHLRLYDSHSGAVLQELMCQHQPHRMAWSADGRWIAVSNFHYPFVSLFQPMKLSTSRVDLSQSFGGTNCIAFSPNSNRLIAGLRNGNVVSWNLATVPSNLLQSDPTMTHSFERQVAPINSSVSAIVSLSDDGLICGGENGTLALCTLTKSNHQFHALDKLSTRSAILTADGRTIFIGTAEGSLVSFDTYTGELGTIVSPKGIGLAKLVLSSDRTFLGMGWDNGDVGIMALPERKMLRFEKNSDQRVPPRLNLMDLHFEPQQNRLVLFRNSDQIQVWECSTTKTAEPNTSTHVATVAAWETERLGSAVCYIPELENLVYGGSAESVHQVGNGAPEQALIVNCSRVSSLLYDSDRQVLISGHNNGIIQQHKLTGELIAVSRHAGVPILPSSNSVDVTKLALSPDGRNLLSGNVEGELRIWDANDLCYIGTIHAGDGQGKISDICFSHDGKRLLYHQAVSGGAIQSGVHLLDLE